MTQTVDRNTQPATSVEADRTTALSSERLLLDARRSLNNLHRESDAMVATLDKVIEGLGMSGEREQLSATEVPELIMPLMRFSHFIGFEQANTMSQFRQIGNDDLTHLLQRETHCVNTLFYAKGLQVEGLAAGLKNYVEGLEAIDARLGKLLLPPRPNLDENGK